MVRLRTLLAISLVGAGIAACQLVLGIQRVDKP
jgi:hypothetical protein